MSMSSDKSSNVLPSRLFSYIIAFSLLLLVLSFVSLLDIDENPLVPKAVLELIHVDRTPSVNLPSPTSNGQIAPVDRTPLVSLPSPTPTGQISPVTSDIMPPRGVDPSKGAVEKELDAKLCDKRRALLRVYMYDLPPKFHFGMLGWTGGANETWPSLIGPGKIPRYPGALNAQHSPEYWLTLDLLASDTDNIVRPCSAVRVHNSSEADIVFVPFFSSLSYNRHPKRRGKEKAVVDKMLQEELVEYLKDSEEWRRSGGKDHLVMAHHPNSMLFARKKLSSSMFLLSDFGRYPKTVANLEKDVIAPYKHMVKTISVTNLMPFNERPTLAYFQGAIYRKDGGVIRQLLYNILKNEKDVHFKYGSVQANGVGGVGAGMAASKFCLTIAGDTPSSNRLFDAIVTHCIPVIISDEIELPYEDILDYSEFCIFVHAADAIKKGYLINLLRGIKQEKWTEMWENLKKITIHFEYQFPSLPNDAVDMIWQAIARKKKPTLLSLHRKNRYNRSWSGTQGKV